MKEFTLWEGAESTKIEWYEPKEKKSDAAVIVFPGGGYVNLCDYEGKDYAEYLNTLGITAFVIYYRRAPNFFPIPLLDARRAVRFVRANAEKFGIAVLSLPRRRMGTGFLHLVRRPRRSHRKMDRTSGDQGARPRIRHFDRR